MVDFNDSFNSIEALEALAVKVGSPLLLQENNNIGNEFMRGSGDHMICDVKEEVDEAEQAHRQEVVEQPCPVALASAQVAIEGGHEDVKPCPAAVGSTTVSAPSLEAVPVCPVALAPGQMTGVPIGGADVKAEPQETVEEPCPVALAPGQMTGVSIGGADVKAEPLEAVEESCPVAIAPSQMTGVSIEGVDVKVEPYDAVEEPCPVALAPAQLTGVAIGGGDVKVEPCSVPDELVTVSVTPLGAPPVHLATFGQGPVVYDQPQPDIVVRSGLLLDHLPSDLHSFPWQRSKRTPANVSHPCNCQMKNVPDMLREFVREGTADELQKGDAFLVAHRKNPWSQSDSEITWRLGIFKTKVQESENIRYRMLMKSEIDGYGLPAQFLDFAGQNRKKLRKATYNAHSHVIRCTGGDRPHFYLLKTPMQRPQNV